MRDKRTTIFRLAVAAMAVFVVGAIVWAKYNEKDAPPDSLVAFAQCLTQKGATFYGAYWCPHCQRQKKLFGKAISEVHYVECAIPGNPNEQTDECKSKDIPGYPTWIFADGSRVSGEQSLESLAAKTGCSLESSASSEEPAATNSAEVTPVPQTEQSAN